MRRFHRDLGAGDDEVSHVERQLGQNGLKTDTKTMAVIARITAPGTAMRSTRTIRLWRAAMAKRASIPA
jgi:hypothetical protein